MYLGRLASERVQDLFARRQRVTPAQLELGQLAWAAFRSSDPREIEALLRSDTTVLPFLAGALHRHLEEYPSVTNGLSRSESQALAAIAGGKRVLREAYAASHHDVEEAVFLGDNVFATYLERLSSGAQPLVLFEDGSPVRSPRTHEEYARFWERSVAVSATGLSVLTGQDDWIALNGIDRCLGGVHLLGPTTQWRWDAAAQQLQPASGD